MEIDLEVQEEDIWQSDTADEGDNDDKANICWVLAVCSSLYSALYLHWLKPQSTQWSLYSCHFTSEETEALRDSLLSSEFI